MGIMKETGSFILVFFLVINVFSQNNYDTIYFSENQFIKHLVKGGESLKSIANLHGVKVSEIKEANELNKRLYYNQLLYIPIYLNNSKKELISAKKLILEDDPLPWENNKNNSTMNIALLMPYYLPSNDSIFYKKSESALSFHIGVELAIDSLRRAGHKIVLHTFDTNQDSITVRNIVYSNKLNDMDIIIGPMYSKLFKMLCIRYGRDPSKILISPLSRDNQEFKEYPSVYQIALTYKVQIDILTDFLMKNKLKERIVIFHEEEGEKLASYLKYKFKKKNKNIESYSIIHTAVDSIREYFVEYQNVFLLSSNKNFICKMLGSIGSIDSTSIVFSLESIISYDNLDIRNLMELNVHIPNSKTIDYTNDYDLSFISLFENEYNTNYRKYSKQGYDIIMHFCGKSDIFNFKQYKRGCFQNISGPIHYYSDYKLVPVYSD